MTHVPKDTHPNQDATRSDVFLSAQQLANRYHVHPATIWRWPQMRGFPRPIKLSPGCTRWRLIDVVGWENTAGGASDD